VAQAQIAPQLMAAVQISMRRDMALSLERLYDAVTIAPAAAPACQSRPLPTHARY
jgi:hypothetical protein